MKKLLFLILLANIYTLSSCSSEEFVIDPDQLNVYGDINEIQVPESVVNTNNPYVEEALLFITTFKDQILYLQDFRDDANGAELVDSMRFAPLDSTVILNPVISQSWNDGGYYTSYKDYQAGVGNNHFYFNFESTVLMGGTETHVKQSRNAGQGQIHIYSKFYQYTVGIEEINWKKSGNYINITFSKRDSMEGENYWTGILELNLNDNSGELSISDTIEETHTDVWWDAEGNGSWTHLLKGSVVGAGNF